MNLTNTSARLRISNDRAIVYTSTKKDKTFINEDLMRKRRNLAFECRKLRKASRMKKKKTKKKKHVCITVSFSYRKGKRKVQGVPQTQTAALPRPQEEEEADNLNKHKPNKRTKALRLKSEDSPSEVIAILKGLKNTRTKWHTEKHTTNHLVE